MFDTQYIDPKTIDEALTLKNKYKTDARILAGGTDLILLAKEKNSHFKYFIDIKKIPELHTLEFCKNQGLSIGAAVNLNRIIDFTPVKEKYPIIQESAKTLANYLLRNRATLVGNICNASPGGDLLSTALVLNAKLECRSVDKTRMIELNQFFTGVKTNILQDNEIVTKIVFPSIKGKGFYMKKSRIKGHDIAQVGMAGFLDDNNNLNIALNAVSPTPVLIKAGTFNKLDLLDENNIKTITQKVLENICPIDDQRCSKEYRISIVKHFTLEILKNLAK